jgi:D-aminoacyl-tRNA deacylase
MRAIVQRVRSARVVVEGSTVGEVEAGLLVLLGVTHDDTSDEADLLARRVAGLRVFDDRAGKMNRSVTDVAGSILVVSQFTLYGDCRKGRRPSFDAAARPEHALALYERFVERVRALGVPVSTGVFQAHMQVELVNDGPVTLILEAAPHRGQVLPSTETQDLPPPADVAE